MKILFWNINNKEAAFRLLSSDDVLFNYSIIGFAEYWTLFDKLSYIGFANNHYDLHIDPIHKRTGLMFSKALFLRRLGVRKYFSWYTFMYNDLNVLLFVVHCKSQLFGNEDASRMNGEIQREIALEILHNKLNTVLIMGDFNIPFFHDHFLNSYCFNSVNYYNNDYEEYKIIEGQKYLKFYNPISALYGDMSKGPPGTYYNNRRTTSQAWHIFDHILISYPLSNYLETDKIDILEKLGDTELLSNNRLPNKQYSDHLPITIEFIDLGG